MYFLSYFITVAHEMCSLSQTESISLEGLPTVWGVLLPKYAGITLQPDVLCFDPLHVAQQFCNFFSLCNLRNLLLHTAKYSGELRYNEMKSCPGELWY